MLFLLVGIIMTTGKYFDIAGLGDVSWWWCVIPFGLAALYWEIADEIFHRKDKQEMKMHQNKLQKQRKKLFEEGGIIKRDYRVIRSGDSEERNKEKLQD